MKNKIAFKWNGIKSEGKLYRAHYSLGGLINFHPDTITIYAKDYSGIPEIEGLTIKNDSDCREDYFEKDRIRVEPSNKFYAEVSEAFKKQKEHYSK